MYYLKIGCILASLVFCVGFFIEIKELKKFISSWLDDTLSDIDISKTIFCKIFCFKEYSNSTGDFLWSFAIGFLIIFLCAIITLLLWPVLFFILTGFIYYKYLKKEKEFRKLKKQENGKTTTQTKA